MIKICDTPCRGDLMFTSVRLKNFRSFDDIVFDLTARDSSAKHIAIVYGENGAGKSNLMSAFVLLNELLETMNVRDMIEDLINEKSIFSDANLGKTLKKQLMAGFRDMQAIINDYRMEGCTEPVVAEYEFVIGKNAGKYTIEFGDQEIVHERLEYLLSKRRGVYFDCTKDEITINSSIVTDKDLLSDIKSAAKRFWGKHSLLAIILHEKRDKSSSFVWDNITDNFGDVLGEFITLSCYLGIGSRRWDNLHAPIGIMSKAAKGTTSIENEHQLGVFEEILTQFFSSINSDIRRVYYSKTFSENKIEYEMYFEKLISGEYRNIPFSKESTGNHQLLRVLCYILSACFGLTVVIDEADSGIHDVLFQKLITEISPKIDGQLIMTTHNTLLMETDFARESTYIIHETSGGHKEIRNVSNYEKRTYLNNNIRNRYLNNGYGGVPEITPIQFDPIIGKLSSVI